MPTKIIKNNSDSFFQANLNNTTETSTFPEQLKYTDVKPAFKKDKQTRKTIDQSSVLPNVSKSDSTILTGKDWCFSQFSIVMAGWLLLISLICLHNQISCVHSIISIDV